MALVSLRASWAHDCSYHHPDFCLESVLWLSIRDCPRSLATGPSSNHPLPPSCDTVKMVSNLRWGYRWLQPTEEGCIQIQCRGKITGQFHLVHLSMMKHTKMCSIEHLRILGPISSVLG